MSEYSDLCEICERDTSYGSGLFVDRISTDEAHICRECLENFEEAFLKYFEKEKEEGRMVE